MKYSEEDLLKTLAELRAEDGVPGAALGRVRARVLERTRGGKRVWWWVPVGAAVVAGVLALVMMRPVERAPEYPLADARGSVPAVVETPAAKPVVKKRVRKPAPPAKETELVQMFTEDPDVVILWALDTNGSKGANQ